MAKNPRPKIMSKPAELRQITADTDFHIDFEWWEKSTMDLRSYLANRLQALGIEDVHFNPDVDEVDLVDMETGEVRRVDGFQFVVQTYFKQLPPDFAQKLSLVDAVFCVLLSNANQPMSIDEISTRIERDSDVVLRTLSGNRVYQGITPVFD